MNWALLVAPLAALAGVFLGQALQKRREVSMRAMQLREEMLLDLAEWTLTQHSRVPLPSIHYDEDFSLLGVYWPTNAKAADSGDVSEPAAPRLLMMVRLYGSPELAKLATSASRAAESSGNVVKSRRTDWVGPSLFSPALASLTDLWRQIQIEVERPPRRRGRFGMWLSEQRGRTSAPAGDLYDPDLLTFAADERWWLSVDNPYAADPDPSEGTTSQGNV